ncbi:MAG TPA: sigma 54-interacting transcriptional regulator [Candidatus Binataceae bacterium]|nr:sigma 54-interacting transcriptional regulator [Candidatus Binataceae bacterium]
MSTSADLRLPARHDSGPPKYFDLFWDSDLEVLIPLLAAIGEQRGEVLARWHDLYLLYFADKRALSREEFFRIYGEDLAATVGTLCARDFDGFVAEMRRIGELLIGREVPFSEVVVSMHLFEESASCVFPPGASPATYHLFDKISHCRTVILADAYFRSRTAAAAARIEGLEQEAAQIPPASRTRFHGLVGASPAMRRLYERIEAAGAVRGTVLVVGETGTGKELVARALHECSPAAHGPFLALNCAAVPHELIESELFGYRRGAFSGATADYAGLFRAAQNGTLFLDEITEMSVETQGKLLRALQERAVRPVGATREIPVNARLVASTNRDPQAAVEEGRIRRDLYYRLHVNVLHVPPLRERLDDIPLLIEHFIQLFGRQLDRKTPITAIDPAALEACRRYSWPGNVRELANAIEAAFTFNRSGTIALDDLPQAIAAAAGLSAAAAPRVGSALSLAGAERELIRRALADARGNKCRAAELLGISRKMLYARMARHGLVWRRGSCSAEERPPSKPS